MYIFAFNTANCEKYIYGTYSYARVRIVFNYCDVHR